MQHKDLSPARFFLIYIAFGMASLLTIVVLSVYFRNQQQEVTLLLALAILFSNFLAVLGYSTAILKREELLADPDAPDLAYYLGFSLTVGALSFSFLADLGAMKNANPQLQAALRSGLVSGSLAQFGAGLLATLIGLCFKIYLSSQQQRTSKDPTELYNQFRIEVGSFSTMLGDLSNKLSSSIDLASAEIRKSGNLASSSMTEMSETLQRASQVISINITNERIAAPINNFINELESISTPLKVANGTLREFTKETTEANVSIKTAASEYLAASQVVRQSALSIDAVSKSVTNLNPDLEELNIKLGDFLSACYSGTDSLRVLSQSANLTSVEFAINTKQLQEFNPLVNESIGKLKVLATEVDQVSQNSKILNASITELITSTANANNSSKDFSESLDLIAQHSKDLVERLDGFSEACANGLTSLQDFQKATDNSSITTREFTERLQESGAVVQSATTDITSFAESITNANKEVTSCVKEVSIGAVEYKVSLADFVSGANAGSQAIVGFSDSLQTTNQSTLSLNTHLVGFSEGAESSLSALKNLERVAISAADATGGYGRAVKDSTVNIEKATLQVETFSGLVDSANLEISKLNSSTNNYNVVTTAQIKVNEDHLVQLKTFLENYNNILGSLTRQQQLLTDLESKLESVIGGAPNISINSVNG
ncbi:MAG: methyl-accepting chemotaxis protein [Gammaproteobacteria bacterium]|nr:methyl-accepting chemotaxis protein [Gammaproteobacteria bacterium]